MKWNKWLAVMSSILVVQLGMLYYVNQFLKPPTLPAVAVIPTAQAATATPQVNVPDSALDPLLSPDHQYVAYLTKEHKLVVDGLQGTVYSRPSANITFKKWLDSSTLLYFNRTSNLAAYILQVSDKKNILVNTWPSLTWEAVDAYFSPYIELLYIELKDQYGYDYIYRYDATTGVSELPLGSIRIRQIEYDSITDTMKIYDSMNGVWIYENNQVTRPDGSKVHITIQKPVNKEKNNAKTDKKTDQQTNKDGKGQNKFEIIGVNGK